MFDTAFSAVHASFVGRMRNMCRSDPALHMITTTLMGFLLVTCQNPLYARVKLNLSQTANVSLNLSMAISAHLKALTQQARTI